MSDSPNRSSRLPASRANILQQRGVKVSYDTVARWARRAHWRQRVEQLRTISGVRCPKDVAATLQIEAEWLTPGLLCGLQFRIAARMAERINQLPLDSPEDYAKLVDVLDKMDGIIHRQRGAHISKRGNRSGNADPLQLDEFRAWRPDSDPKSE